MADLFLQDTSFWILTHRRGTPQRIIDRAADLIEARTVAINDVVRAEVLLGYKSHEEFVEVADEIDGLPRLELSRQVWAEATELGFRLARVGAKIPLPDLLVASSAMHYNATLLHRDSDFETIAQHSNLRTESYLDAV